MTIDHLSSLAKEHRARFLQLFQDHVLYFLDTEERSGMCLVFALRDGGGWGGLGG